MSPAEMRARADQCDRLANSLGPSNGEYSSVLQEVAEQWRWLANDADKPAISAGRASLMRRSLATARKMRPRRSVTERHRLLEYLERRRREM
jgi:hypothetical protein